MFWNDPSGNIVPFIMSGGGRHLFKLHTADQEVALNTTEQTAWDVQAINIPETASVMFGFIRIEDASGRRTTGYGCSDAALTLPNGNTVHDDWFTDANMAEILFLFSEGAGDSQIAIQIPIANRAAPAIGVGVLFAQGPDLSVHDMVVQGFVDPWAPRT
jgi:hypothetical protein